MVALALGLALVQVNGLEDVTLDIGGVKRQFYAYFPKTKDLKPRPVVFAFHGHGGNSRYSVRKFKVNESWPEAISIYMQGLPTKGAITDPEGQKSGWQKDVGDYEDRDLKFFDAVLKWVHEKAKINDKAVFALGHSNGGTFTYLVWKARPGILRAIAPAAAAGVSARGTTPIPVFHTSGENDPLVGFRMQTRTVNYVLGVDKCEGEGKSIGKNMTRWESKVGAPVVRYVHDGGHELPEEALSESIKFLKSFAKD